MNREVDRKKFRLTLRHKANLITMFCQVAAQRGEGRMCSEDENFYQNMLILKEKKKRDMNVVTVGSLA